MKLVIAIAAVTICLIGLLWARPERRHTDPQVHLHPRLPMTYDEMLRQRLQALLEAIEPGVTSDLLIAEYQRIHEEVTRLQEEREWK